MQITKYGHSCLHVTDGDASILVDPGAFSEGYEDLRDLTAILVTHVHEDHLDVAKAAELVRNNPQATVYADPAAAEKLDAAGVTTTVAKAGDAFDVGTSVQVVGELHAVIHQDLPRNTNVGYLIGGRLLHPGDALIVPDQQVEILAIPVMAPWMALKEAVDYERAVHPKVAIPIHDALIKPFAAMFYGRLTELAPAGTTFIELTDGKRIEL
ncbi:MBL fold metallo-hydrolase [Nakamurella aerolata]|uniref:MBL fold metallo-hydrolase n=1 Tax=Nakamurella aerolata TaxID=1656892 RepID=A0A849A8Z0_9ACTN|nr:MBL fold metallo-hydrolase [Nakamurella aerolata]NNG35568.1 MBL fold metallo-hydrolase [Nakamurella aerolata]